MINLITDFIEISSVFPLHELVLFQNPSQGTTLHSCPHVSIGFSLAVTVSQSLLVFHDLDAF